MSGFSPTVRPHFEGIADCNQNLEKRGLEQIKERKEGGFDDDELDADIDTMCDRAKRENANQIEKLRKTLHGIKPETAEQQPRFKKWLKDECNPMVDGVIKLLANVCDSLRNAAREILQSIMQAISLIKGFFDKRKLQVLYFFTQFF